MRNEGLIVKTSNGVALIPQQTLFARRKLELFLSGYTLCFGLWLVLPFASMDAPGFRLLLEQSSEEQWGALFFFNGLSHALALLVNGHRWWSPLIRWFAAMTSMLVYGSMAYLFWLVNPHTTAVANYGLLSTGAGLCLFTAWQDARLALRIEYATRRTHHA